MSLLDRDSLFVLQLEKNADTDAHGYQMGSWVRPQVRPKLIYNLKIMIKKISNVLIMSCFLLRITLLFYFLYNFDTFILGRYLEILTQNSQELLLIRYNIN